MNREMLWGAVSTVIRNRVTRVGTGRGKMEIYEIGSGTDTIVVRISTIDNITRLMSCTCKHHSVKDIYKRGYCSSVLAVFLYKMIPIYNRLKGEMLP